MEFFFYHKQYCGAMFVRTHGQDEIAIPVAGFKLQFIIFLKIGPAYVYKEIKTYVHTSILMRNAECKNNLFVHKTTTQQHHLPNNLWDINIFIYL